MEAMDNLPWNTARLAEEVVRTPNSMSVVAAEEDNSVPGVAGEKEDEEKKRYVADSR